MKCQGSKWYSEHLKWDAYFLSIMCRKHAVYNELQITPIFFLLYILDPSPDYWFLCDYIQSCNNKYTLNYFACRIYVDGYSISETRRDGNSECGLFPLYYWNQGDICHCKLFQHNKKLGFDRKYQVAGNFSVTTEQSMSLMLMTLMDIPKPNK